LQKIKVLKLYYGRHFRMSGFKKPAHGGLCAPSITGILCAANDKTENKK